MASQLPCALRAVAGAFHARHPSWPKPPCRPQRPARARSDLEPPQPPNRPQPRPPERLSVAAERRHSGGLNACEVWPAGLCEPGEVRLRGRCTVGPLALMFVHVISGILSQTLNAVNT